MLGSLDDPRLTDGVVALRLPDERDLPAIDLGIHDAEVVRWFGQPTRTAQEVLDWIGTMGRAADLSREPGLVHDYSWPCILMQW